MQRVEKTVFISYRRTNAPWALAIYQNLTQHGFNVFFDFLGIASGDFERVILENITARAHFLVLLTPSALERCGDPGDLLRREIETALETRRNIVPLTLESFDFGTPTIASQLTGKLASLKRYNALHVPVDYFAEAMGRLREKHLNVPLDAVLHPASDSAQQAVRGGQAAASAAPVVQEKELTAQQWFEQGFNATDLAEKLRYYGEAIRLQPDFAEAYINRGIARSQNGDLDGGLQDFDEAIRLKPDFAEGYYNRGAARSQNGDLDGALQDYDEAIRLKPDYTYAHYNRGIARREKGDLDGALQDYDEAIRLKPDDTDAHYNRGITRREKGDLDGALQDFDEAIRLKPDYTDAHYSRGIVRSQNGDLDGALQDYDEAIRLKPDYTDAHYDRGIVRSQNGDLDGALQDYDEAIRLKPDYTYAHYNRGKICEGKADYPTAIRHLQKYLDLGGGVRDGDQAEVEQTIRDLMKKL